MPGTTSGMDNGASCQMMAPESLQDGIFSDKTDVVRDQKQYEVQGYAES